jgi:hypothetical protein
MIYIKDHAGDQQIGFIGDEPKDLWLALFADADFAGDRDKTKSTGGTFLVLMGPNIIFPLTGTSKKHGSTSNSSTEAKIVTLAIAVRTMRFQHLTPSRSCWEEKC